MGTIPHMYHNSNKQNPTTNKIKFKTNWKKNASVHPLPTNLPIQHRTLNRLQRSPALQEAIDNLRKCRLRMVATQYVQPGQSVHDANHIHQVARQAHNNALERYREVKATELELRKNHILQLADDLNDKNLPVKNTDLKKLTYIKNMRNVHTMYSDNMLNTLIRNSNIIMASKYNHGKQGQNISINEYHKHKQNDKHRQNEKHKQNDKHIQNDKYKQNEQHLRQKTDEHLQADDHVHVKKKEWCKNILTARKGAREQHILRNAAVILDNVHENTCGTTRTKAVASDLIKIHNVTKSTPSLKNGLLSKFKTILKGKSVEIKCRLHQNIAKLLIGLKR